MAIYQPYSPGSGIPPSGNVSNVKQSPGAPNSPLLSSFISRLPYALQVVDAIVRNNPKFHTFRDQASL
jgi:hypothetical protein